MGGRLELTRRGFVASAVATLVVSMRLTQPGSAQAAPDESGGGLLNPFISVDKQGNVRLVAPAFDMGQGTHTSLAMILCDELGANWEQVTVVGPEVDPAFVVPGINEQATHGSFMVRNWHDPLRKAAAAAREMLVQAAATRWNVDPASCEVSAGLITSAGNSLGFGDLIEDASRLPVPENPQVRNTKVLVGTPTKRIDIPSKVNGSAKFGIDVRLPGMVYAAIRQAPVYGSKLESVSSPAESSDNIKIVELPSAVIAIADTFWKAKSAVEGFSVVFATSDNDALTSSDITAQRTRQLDEGTVARPIVSGDPDAALAATSDGVSGNLVTATYTTPFLAHMTMEPMNCTVWMKDGKCEIWVPTQGLSATVTAAAAATGLSKDNIVVHPTTPGGGFGRKYEADFVVQAIAAAKATDRPVQLIWTREEDIQHDFYRPAMTGRLTAALSPEGDMNAFIMRKVGPSIVEHMIGSALIDGSDPIAWLGFGSQTKTAPGELQQYAVENVAAEFVFQPTHVPIGFWRSVGAGENGFFIESFVDELAHSAHIDPYEFRRRLLRESPRGRAVLDKAASEAGWGNPLPTGHFHGIAFTDVVGSLVAQVAEVSMNDGTPTVHRMVVAVDCGTAINPDSVIAQMQGAVVMGLSSALNEQVEIADGRCMPSNFYDYHVHGLADTPRIDVHIIDSSEPLGGVGEAGVPAVAPALANAIFAASGRRIRSLPIMANL